MKKLISFFCCLLAAALLVGCGNVLGVQKIFGTSERFSKTDIDSAMNVVIGYFVMEFSGCTMTEIKYEESPSAASAAEWAQQYGAEQAIILTSTFLVGSSGGDGSLNPNSTYRNWQWILVRSGGSMWELKTWGYG